MKKPVNSSTAVKLDGFRHFSKAVAQQVRNSLKPVLDGILVEKQHLCGPCNAAVAVQKIDTGRIKQIVVFPVSLQRCQRQGAPHSSGLPFVNALAAGSCQLQFPLQEHFFMRENALGILQIVD